MYPREHALISAAVTLLAGLYQGLAPEGLLLWTITGTAAGVFIDADHIPVAMLFNDKLSEGLYWLKHPLRALTNPAEMVESIDPGTRLRPHRMVSHLLVFLALIAVQDMHPLVVPAIIGLAAHIAADVVWDFSTADGFPYL